MRKRVLITGGFGYLGGRVSRALAYEGKFIVRLGSRELKPAPMWLPEAETVAFDLLQPSSLEDAMSQVDIVVHLAAMNENDCINDPAQALLVNGLGTFNMVQAAITASVEKFIYFSTAHVYGSPLSGHITEQTIPRPIHPYATSHRTAEDFVLAAHHKKELQGIVLRLSNGFGAPTHPNLNRWTLIVNDLCRQAVQTKKLVLRSNGLQLRDFITLSDICSALIHVLDWNQKQSGDGLYNLGGDMVLSVCAMVQHIAERCHVNLGYKPEIMRPILTTAEEDEAARLNLVYDSSKIQKTGLHLKKNINEAVDETLKLSAQWFV